MALQYAGYGTWNVRKKRRQRWNRPEEWEIVENAHPAIITEAQARQLLRVRGEARAIHAHTSTRMSQVRSSGSRFVLSGGLFKCARCGANMTSHLDRGRDGYICGSAKYRRGLGCGPSLFIEKQLIEEAAWDTIGAWADTLLDGRSKRFAAKVNAELRREWEAQGGKASSLARQRLQKIDQKIGNLRAAIEDGLCDVEWANRRLRDLIAEREAVLSSIGGDALATEPPRVDEDALERYLPEMRRLLPHASNQEKRELARRFLEGVSLEPGRREIEVRVKLPPNTLQRVEAGTLIALIGTILASHALIRLQYTGGRGTHGAELLELSAR